MKEAEEHLKGMEKCCGLQTISKKLRKQKRPLKKDDDGGVISDQPRITVGDSSMGPQGGYVTRITNDAREDEMDDTL
ncbi:SNAP-25 family protein [Cooperia oncophora]